MKTSRYLRSELVVKVTHTDIPRLLKAWTDFGVTIYSAKTIDTLTAELIIPIGSYKKLKEIASKRSANIEIIRKNGLYWKAKYFSQRPWLIVCFFAVLFLSIYTPSRIWFVTVKGNTLLAERKILEAAETAGIYFGAARRTVRSEQTKNRLLEAMPQLQWVGVNTRGCVAEISVSERNPGEADSKFEVSDGIIASRDGVIRSVTVTSGNSLCEVGQVVKAGELLVSSYRDCGILIQREKPEGEIFAETLRKIDAVIPVNRAIKGDVTHTIRKYSLRIGKKRIKIYKDSGIYGTSCDKMYEEYCIKLPGGISLPVAVIVEQWQMRESSTVPVSGNDLTLIAKTTAETYLLQQMIAGQVLSTKTDIVQDGTVCRISGQYRCLEMIGRVQSEEFSANYG